MIKSLQITVAAFLFLALPVTASAATSSRLFPTADGGVDSANWLATFGGACNGTDCFSQVNETTGSQCSNSDGDTTYIQSSTEDAAQTFDLSLSDVPDNVTITDIAVTACHVKGQSGKANKFQTRYCVSGICTDSGNDITPPANYNETSQNFSGLSITKTGTTDLEIGVVITDDANKQTRVSQLSAVLTYTTSSAGSESTEGSESKDGKSGDSSGKGHASQAPLFSPDGGADEAPIRLEQGHEEETPAGTTTRIVTAIPGQTLTVTARPVDFDRAKTVRLRTDGHVYQLKDNNKDGVYELPLRLPSAEGSVAYSLTVDYGVTTRTEYGSFVLGARQPQTTPRTPTHLLPFINRLFRAVHNRDPSAREWDYWASRVQAGHQHTLPELYGAMQWQEKFGGKPQTPLSNTQ